MIHSFNGIKPTIDEECFIADGVHIIGDVVLKKGVSIWFNTVLRGDIEQIFIDENSNVQDCSVIHTKHGTPTEIGKNVTIGHNAVLHSCRIGDNTLIGMGAIVLDDVKIGKNCIIAAGSVISPNTIIPDNSVVMGNPGKIKRDIRQVEIDSITKNALTYTNLYKGYNAELSLR